MEQVMKLTDAAASLGLSYGQTLRLVLVRKLRGERRDGHWVVDAQDVVRLRQRDRAPELATV